MGRHFLFNHIAACLCGNPPLLTKYDHFAMAIINTITLSAMGGLKIEDKIFEPDAAYGRYSYSEWLDQKLL